MITPKAKQLLLLSIFFAGFYLYQRNVKSLPGVFVYNISNEPRILLNESFCTQTKQIRNVSLLLCHHDPNVDLISRVIKNEKIWDEAHLSNKLKYLLLLLLL